MLNPWAQKAEAVGVVHPSGSGGAIPAKIIFGNLPHSHIYSRYYQTMDCSRRSTQHQAPPGKELLFRDIDGIRLRGNDN